MTADSNQVPNHSEDTFLLAVERLEAGEALETVLTAFPEEERADLRELLTIVAATHHLQQIDIPRPSAERRHQAKAKFLLDAASLKAAIVEEDAKAAVPVQSSPLRSNTEAKGLQSSTLGEQFAVWWSDFVAGFMPMSVRLAPLAIMVIAIWLGAFSVVSVAQAAIPGDAVYPAKRWVYEQKLTLAAPEDRKEIYDEITDEVAKDLKRAEERATEEQTIRKDSIDLYLVSIGQQYIEAGEMTFELGFQESLNSSALVATEMNGIPIENALATIEYQIVPQRVDENGNVVPSRYQAISVTIIESPVVIPTEIPQTVETTAPQSVPATGCVVSAPAGWVSYSVPSGMTLSEIAKGTGVAVNDLARYNCIANANVIRTGQRILVPYIPAARATPTLPPATATPLEITLTAISTTHITPALTITAPVDTTPTAPISVTATVTATSAVESSTPTATLAMTPTAQLPTVEATVVMTEPVATETVVPTMVPTATIGTTPTPDATAVEPVETPTPDATNAETPEALATPTPVATAEVDTTATAGTTPEEVQTTTPEPTVEGAGSVPTVEGAGESTATATPITTIQNATAEATTIPEIVQTVEPTATAINSDTDDVDIGTTGNDNTTDGTVDSSTDGSDNQNSSDNSTKASPTAIPVPATATATVPPLPTPIPTLARPTATPSPVNQSPLGGG